MSIALAGSLIVAPVLSSPAAAGPQRIVQIVSADPAYQGKCVRSTTGNEGTFLQLAECHSGDQSQHWEALDGWTGFTRLRNIQTGLCALAPMGEAQEITGGTCQSSADVQWTYRQDSQQIQRALISVNDTAYCWKAQPRHVVADNCAYGVDGKAQDWHFYTI